jgi:flagellar biosynthesis protein FlhB
LPDNRTERATPKRRTKAVEAGQVLRSRDLVSAVTLLAVILVLAWRPPMWIGRWQTYFARVLDSGIHSDWAGGGAPALGWTILAVAHWLGPIFAVAFAAAIASTFAQGGFHFSVRALSPNWTRLHPVSNTQRLFTLAVLSRLLRSLLPAGVIFYLAFRLLLNDAGVLLHAAHLPPRAALALLGHLAYTLAWQSGMVLLAWSAVDYVLQRRTFEKSLRMTKQEVRQEGKDNAGSPLAKGRIKRLHREIVRRAALGGIR